MNWRRLTALMLVILVFAIGAYDVVALWRSGYEATISSVLLENAQHYPILAFMLGVLSGHVFWPNRKDA